ncbi:unnamed protein product [Prunus brigantina]
MTSHSKMQSKQITLKIESVRSNSENALATVFVKISIPEIHGAKSEVAVTRENKSEVYIESFDEKDTSATVKLLLDDRGGADTGRGLLET